MNPPRTIRHASEARPGPDWIRTAVTCPKCKADVERKNDAYGESLPWLRCTCCDWQAVPDERTR